MNSDPHIPDRQTELFVKYAEKFIVCTNELSDILSTFEAKSNEASTILKKLNEINFSEDTNGYYTTLQALSILKVSPRTLQSYRSTGLIRYKKSGHDVLHLASDVDNFKRRRIEIKNEKRHLREYLNTMKKANQDNP